LKPIETISKEFEAGVTAISSHPFVDHVFAVGSYDEYVRLYDSRMLKEPLWKVHVGGGVWRIKWHPMCSNKGGMYNKLLVAAMHGGCRVVEFTDLPKSRECGAFVEVVSTFTEHKSMAYGADWIWFDGQNEAEAAASCSFYDRQAFLWSP
jgi:diphthamide biosynthesis protein 7